LVHSNVILSYAVASDQHTRNNTSNNQIFYLFATVIAEMNCVYNPITWNVYVVCPILTPQWQSILHSSNITYPHFTGKSE